MHASSIIALALGAAAVSATALPDLEVRDGTCDPACNFPKSMYCTENGGAEINRDEMIALARNADRSGKPIEESSSNISSEFCHMTRFRNMPFWSALVPGPKHPMNRDGQDDASTGTKETGLQPELIIDYPT
ncbi:hypothetical protein DDE82_006188 [Stemphylium lycopersici]|nr:hypothetical protein DDE82_006188 [Stemphylium lycopersici]